MPTKKELSEKYALLIIKSKDKERTIWEIKYKIESLTYDNGNTISEKDIEQIWDNIEVALKEFEEKNIIKLFEHENKATLELISFIRGWKRK